MNVAFAGMVSSSEVERALDHCHPQEEKVHLEPVYHLFAERVIDSPYAQHNCLHGVDYRRSRSKVTQAALRSPHPSDNLRHPIAKHQYPEMTVGDPDFFCVVSSEIHQKLRVTTDRVVVVLVLVKGTAPPYAIPYDEVKTLHHP